jgi:hypothetical protein
MDFVFSSELCYSWPISNEDILFTLLSGSQFLMISDGVALLTFFSLNHGRILTFFMSQSEAH